MENTSKEITFEMLLQSLHKDFNPVERERLLNVLKNSNPTDSSLLGAKFILEHNNWDYRILNEVFDKSERRVDSVLKSKVKTNYRKQFIQYAAVLIPIAALMAFFLFQQNPSIDEYYTKDEGLPVMMSDDKPKQWDDLMQLYNSGKTNKAFKLSYQILSNKKENDTAQYYYAVLAYEMKHFNIAEEYFNKLIQDKNSDFRYDAEYRLGFVLEQLNDKKRAKQQFKKVISDENNPFQEEATKILSEFYH